MPYGSLPSPSQRAHTWGRTGRPATNSALQGHHVGSAPPRGRVRSLAFDATLRAASPHQVTRETNGIAIHLRPSDLREKVLEGRLGRLLLFVVDASGSMSARRRLALAKGTVRVLLLDAYRRRDRVGLIAFGGAGARLVLPPTSSVDLAERRLSRLTTGGRTPLAEALDLAYLTLARWPLSGAPVLVLVSDGRANSAPPGVDPWWASIAAAGRLKRAGIATAVVDADRGGDRLGLTQALATALGASVLRPRAPAEVAAPALAARVRRLAAGAEAGRVAPAARWS
jgi:magnesium chelatase subunit D